MAGGKDGWFIEPGMPDVGDVPELAVLSAATEAQDGDLPAAGSGASHRAYLGRKSGYVWVPAYSCPAPPGWDADQSQDRMAHPAAEKLAFLHAEPRKENLATARGASECSGTQPPMGLGHHGDKNLVRRKRPLGGHHRLRRPDDPFLAVWAANGFGRAAGDGSGGGLPALRSREGKGPSHRVLIGQRAGICLPETTDRAAGLRDGHLPDAPQKPGIQRTGRGFFREFQTGLRLSEGTAQSGGCRQANTRMDQRLQRGRSAQRLGNETPGRILCGMDVKNKHYICADLGGAEQNQ